MVNWDGVKWLLIKIALYTAAIALAVFLALFPLFMVHLTHHYRWFLLYIVSAGVAAAVFDDLDDSY